MRINIQPESLSQKYYDFCYNLKLNVVEAIIYLNVYT